MVKLSLESMEKDCQLSSSLVKGLCFKLINSTYANDTILWVENIAKFGSAPGNGEKNVNLVFAIIWKKKYTLSIKLLPTSSLCKCIRSHQTFLELVV